jgi:hypothetical protein
LDAATTFFLAILAWQLSYTAQLAAHPHATSHASLRLKCALCVATSAALVAFFALASVDLMGYYREIATCEWIVAFGSMASVWSLSTEFGGEVGRSGGGGGGAAAARGMELGSLWRGPSPGGTRTGVGGNRGVVSAGASVCAGGLDADVELLLELTVAEGVGGDEGGSYYRLA